MSVDEQAVAQDLHGRVRALLEEHDPAGDAREFLGARFDAGLAWVHFPSGSGGLDLPRGFQSLVEDELTAAGAPVGGGPHNGIGMGMAAPTIAAFGTEEQRRKFLRPLFTGEHFYCQLFSEPGAGSDLAGVSTRAVRDGDDWIVNGQKVWTSSAQKAQRAILVARTDPTVPKHQGLTYFVCDMTAPEVEVRPLRQLTGEAEFNEVFLTDVRIPDEDRIGAVGEGWKVANATLMSERVNIGASRAGARESGMIGPDQRHEAGDSAGNEQFRFPRADLSIRIQPGAQIEQRRRSLRIPAVFVGAHPLNPDRLSHGSRQQDGIGRSVFMAVAPIATSPVDVDTADALVCDTQHRSQLLA